MVFTRSLKQNHLFRRMYQRGKSAPGRYVVVYCRKNGLAYNRLGLTVGTKVGHAVVRNRIRRRIREAYRLSESHYLTGYDIVVVARGRAADATYREIADCLWAMSQKLGLIRKEPHHEAPASVADPILSE
jgi:ribonuclease P protein component